MPSTSSSSSFLCITTFAVTGTVGAATPSPPRPPFSHCRRRLRHFCHLFFRSLCPGSPPPTLELLFIHIVLMWHSPPPSNLVLFGAFCFLVRRFLYSRQTLTKQLNHILLFCDLIPLLFCIYFVWHCTQYAVRYSLNFSIHWIHSNLTHNNERQRVHLIAFSIHAPLVASTFPLPASTAKTTGKKKEYEKKS